MNMTLIMHHAMLHRYAVRGAVVLPLVFLFFVNPATSTLIPPCPVLSMTGFYCPGCGSLRATHALLHGDAIAGLLYNPLFVAVLATSMLWPLLRRILRGNGIETTQIEARVVSLLPWIIVAYWVLRNIPVFPFSLLAPHVPA
jgi:hypothetical protein